MGKNYRTAQGKILDMASLEAKNEKIRAVGINMQVNARGDTIDPYNNVIVPVTQKVGKQYQGTVGNKSAHEKKSVRSKQQDSIKEDFSLDELNFQDDLDKEDKIIEAVKKNESKE